MSSEKWQPFCLGLNVLTQELCTRLSFEAILLSGIDKFAPYQDTTTPVTQSGPKDIWSTKDVTPPPPPPPPPKNNKTDHIFH